MLNFNVEWLRKNRSRICWWPITLLNSMMPKNGMRATNVSSENERITRTSVNSMPTPAFDGALGQIALTVMVSRKSKPIKKSQTKRP